MAFKSLLDPTFTYRNAANTDVRLTFERIRRELREQRRRNEGAPVVAVLEEAARRLPHPRLRS